MEEPSSEAPAAPPAVEPACVEWVKARVNKWLASQMSQLTWLQDHDDIVAEFLWSPTTRRLVAFIDPVLGLCLQTGLPAECPNELMYLLKPADVQVTEALIAKQVQYGAVRGGTVGSLLRVMTGVFVPLCLKDQSWPDTIKKEFSGQMHKFMASLTETAWDAVRGK